MALVSPGIELKETSVQSTVVINATGRAAIVGKFQWGPAFSVTQITDEVELVDTFGGPNNQTADYFMSGMNFLQYGNDLRTVRVVNKDVAKNASPLVGNIEWTIAAAGSNYAIGDKIKVKYLQNTIEEEGKITKVDTDGKILSVFIPSSKIIAYAKSINQYPALGTSWTAEITSSSSGVSGSITIGKIITDSGIVLTDSETAFDDINNDKFQTQLAKYKLPSVVAIYPGEIGSTLEVEIVSKKAYEDKNSLLQTYPAGGTKASTAKVVFGYGPQKDSQYAIIVRRDGSIVESMVLSTEKNDRDIYGNNIFMDDYFANGSSKYIFASAAHWPEGFSGYVQLGGGLSANEAITAGDMIQGWDLFGDREALRVNLFIAGACAGEVEEFSSTVQKHVSSLADERQDCLVLISPPKSAIVNIPLTRAVDNLIDWREGNTNYEDANMNINSTYSTIDGNYKYQYDKYNDVNRWVPLAADIAGLCARTDSTSQTWMSPAGYRRGQILNCIKLAIEPRQSHRNRMYQAGINPVTGQGTGEGFILYGDKTATTVPTPFDRINVRRLFNMLKNNIGDSSKYQLFELNDNFTRSAFRTETSQYLNNIKALGGVYEFRVVCDTTNNTPTVIDRNEFVATFYIKPARSINYITLNFVATSTGADFDELIGQSS